MTDARPDETAHARLIVLWHRLTPIERAMESERIRRELAKMNAEWDKATTAKR